MDKLQFHLPSFDGPLDLLLHLIRKHKLNIHDIEISALLEQYLNFLNDMQAENLEITSEFLEMAARLVHIKSVMLLPRYEEETEELKREGVARELVNRIQNIRKEADFAVTDKIRVEIEAKEAVVDSLSVWADFIGQQTLALKVKAVAEPAGSVVVDSDLDEEPLKIAVTRL